MDNNFGEENTEKRYKERKKTKNKETNNEYIFTQIPNTITERTQEYNENNKNSWIQTTIGDVFCIK